MGDTADDGGEVVVTDDEFGGLAGDVGAGLAHGDPDMGAAQGGGIIDSVAGDGHEVTGLLGRFHDAQFLVWGDAGEDRDVGDGEDAIALGGHVLHGLEMGGSFLGGEVAHGQDAFGGAFDRDEGSGLGEPMKGRRKLAFRLVGDFINLWEGLLFGGLGAVEFMCK